LAQHRRHSGDTFVPNLDLDRHPALCECVASCSDAFAPTYTERRTSDRRYRPRPCNPRSLFRHRTSPQSCCHAEGHGAGSSHSDLTIPPGTEPASLPRLKAAIAERLITLEQRNPAIPPNRGHLRLVDSCNFPVLPDYRTPVHFVSGVRWCAGPGGHRTRRAPGGGRPRLPAFAALRGRRRLSAQGQASRVPVPGSWTVRGCPAVTAGLDAEGRPRTLARRVPRPGRGSPFRKVGGGEAASFWF